MTIQRQQPIAFSDNGKDGYIAIDLTKGHIAHFDMIDKDLAYLNWTASETGNMVYALRRDPVTRKAILMHKVIMERILDRPLLPDEKVDHQNDCGTDNKRSNLRLANAKENAMNIRKKRKNNDGNCPTSMYKGVSYIKEKQKWYAQICLDGEKVNLGYFDTEDEAAMMYDKCAAALYPKHAKLNFPNEYYASKGHKQNRSAKRKPKPSTTNNPIVSV
jgi:hypothetical protein